MKIDFEQFLIEEHANRYTGPKYLMIDDFNEWVEELSVDEWLEYGNLYIKKCLEETK